MHVVHPAPSRWQGAGAVALLVGTVVVLGISGLFLWSMNQSRMQPAFSQNVGDQGDVASLRDRLASDEARLASLERGGAGEGLKTPLTQAQADLASLSARVGKLEIAPYPQTAARLDEFDRRLAAMRSDMELRVAALERNALGSDLPLRIAALTSAQTALEARVSKLENTEPSVVMRHAAAELALANLVRASGAATPFTAELETFHALMPDASETGELMPIARNGAPTLTTLNERFPDMAAKALAAENRGEARSWLGRLWANIGNVIVVRRIGDVPGADSDSILARAGTRLNRNDLAGAVREMKALKGAARASAQVWLGEAEARLAIERDTRLLAQRLARLLAAP